MTAFLETSKRAITHLEELGALLMVTLMVGSAYVVVLAPIGVLMWDERSRRDYIAAAIGYAFWAACIYVLSEAIAPPPA